MCLEKPCFTVCKWCHRQNINKRLQNIQWHDRFCVKQSMNQSATVSHTAKTENSAKKSLMDDPSRVLKPSLSFEHLCKVPQDDVHFWIQGIGQVLTSHLKFQIDFFRIDHISFKCRLTKYCDITGNCDWYQRRTLFINKIMDGHG